MVELFNKYPNKLMHLIIVVETRHGYMENDAFYDYDENRKVTLQICFSIFPLHCYCICLAGKYMPTGHTTKCVTIPVDISALFETIEISI